jgi:hypothetical protein
VAQAAAVVVEELAEDRSVVTMPVTAHNGRACCMAASSAGPACRKSSALTAAAVGRPRRSCSVLSDFHVSIPELGDRAWSRVRFGIVLAPERDQAGGIRSRLHNLKGLRPGSSGASE